MARLKLDDLFHPNPTRVKFCPADGKHRGNNPAKTKDETIKAFYSKILPMEVTGCMEWGAGISKNGYGVFWCNNKQRSAHQVAYVLKHGEVPDGLFVLHRCDNKKCVNVDHLFLGTPKDNMDDMADKYRAGGRGAKQTSKEASKLIWKLHKEGLGYKRIGDQVGICRTVVRMVIKRELAKLIKMKQELQKEGML